MRDLLALTGHALHGFVVLGGLVGTAALLAPGVAQRAGLLRAPDGPLDRRVADLRERVAAGTLAQPSLARHPEGGPYAPGRGPRSERPGDPEGPGAVGVGDPLLAAALVAGIAAAGVHAAVGPMHLADYPVLALGFLATAVLQAGWALAALGVPGPASPTPGPRPADTATRLAVLGALVQGAALAAWALSRTAGLPFGLHGEGPQPVGAWDLAAVVWQAVALWWCLAFLAGRRPTARAGGGCGTAGLRPAWGAPGVRAFVVVSALALVVLTLSGASA